jgi:membrane protease YdiL (CAAX protease family)
MMTRTSTDNHLLSLSPVQLALAYLAALTAAEVLTTLVEPRVGLVLHGVLLTALLIHTALTWEHPTHKLLLSLAFAPLIRLLSLSLPLARFPLVYWYFIISVPLFTAAALVALTLRLSWAEIGLRVRAVRLQALVGLTGLIFGYVEYQILKPAPLAQSLAWEQIWLPILILLVSTGFVEELIFRGVMQRAVTEALGRMGMLYVAALFAVLHIGYKSWVDVLFVFGVAIFFGWVVARTRSLLGVTLFHGLTNIMLFLVVPLAPFTQQPAATPTPAATPSPTLSATVIPTRPSGTTPTRAATPAPSATATPGATLTRQPPATPTLFPTATPAAAFTPRPWATPTPSLARMVTAVPSRPPSATPTLFPTATPAATFTPQPWATLTPSPTPLPEPTFLIAEVQVAERCWLHVEVDGWLVFQGIMLGGEKQTWQAKRDVYLWIGNAGGIRVRINAEDQGVLGKHAEVVHRVWRLGAGFNE